MVQRDGLRALLSALTIVLSTLSAQAQTLLRDPDIEFSLNQLLRPLVNVSGLNASRIDVLVIKDDRINAFIVNDRTIFIHSGLVLRAGSAAELQAVLAHELAHIANGHISRRLSNARAATRTTVAGLALGIAAGLASGDGPAGLSIAGGVAASAQRTFLGHSRSEEAAADASGLRYMAEAGIDPRATITLLERFRGQEALNASRQDLYVRGHPLTEDRLRAAKGLAAKLRVADFDQGDADYRFLRAQVKLSAFLHKPGFTLRKTSSSVTPDLAVMRRAIAYHRSPDPQAARAEIDRLATMRPSDPFVHELRGQILLENRDLDGAVDAYARAAKLAPRNALILGGLGRAYLAAGQTEHAVDTLTRARARDSRNPGLLRDLAVAHSKLGQNGQASLATAERYALLGRGADATLHAQRAAGLLPAGSTGWRRAQDILDAQARRK